MCTRPWGWESGDEAALRTVMCLDLQDPLKTNSYMLPSPC